MRRLTLMPAYGQTYSTKAMALAAYNGNKEFYCLDLRFDGYTTKEEVQDLANKRNEIIVIDLHYGAYNTSITPIYTFPEKSHE